MGNRTQSVEWKICYSEDEWLAMQEREMMEERAVLTRKKKGALKRWYVATAVCALLLAIMSGWAWYAAQDGLAQIESELRTASEIDLWRMKNASSKRSDTWTHQQTISGQQQVHETALIHVARQQGVSQSLDIADLEIVTIKGEQAVTRLIMVTEPGDSSYRQTRFYRHSAIGWLRAEPDPNLWGTPQVLETPHLQFRFRSRDSQVVTAVAEAMDNLYITMAANFALPLSHMDSRIPIEIDITRKPGRAWFLDPELPLVVPSPALYLAPIELSENDLLAQSIALAMLEYVVEQAITEHGIDPRWQPLMGGLGLWQLWETDLPLSFWRDEVVQWTYRRNVDLRDEVGLQVENSVQPPDWVAALCAQHALWMNEPLQIQIPLLCTDELSTALLWRTLLQAPTHIEHFSIPVQRQSETDYFWDYYGNGTEPAYSRQLGPEQTVALATLIEYISSTYGREQLPLLLSNLRRFDAFDELLAAILNISVNEVDSAWHAFMAEQYDVSDGIKRPQQ